MYYLMTCCLRNLYPLCFPFRYNQSRFSACVAYCLFLIAFTFSNSYSISSAVSQIYIVLIKNKVYFYPPHPISLPPHSSKRATMKFLSYLPPSPFGEGRGGAYILSGTSIPNRAIPFLITLATFLARTRRVIFSASESALRIL